MKNLILGSFAVFVILSQVACSSDDEKMAAQAYANNNNCTVLGMAPQQMAVTPGQAAAQAQVPCSLQKVSDLAAAATKANTNVAGLGQVPPATSAQAQLNNAIKMQSAKVQAQLAALPAQETPSQAFPSDIARGPASVESAPAPAASKSTGEGEASR